MMVSDRTMNFIVSTRWYTMCFSSLDGLWLHLDPTVQSQIVVRKLLGNGQFMYISCDMIRKCKFMFTVILLGILRSDMPIVFSISDCW